MSLNVSTRREKLNCDKDFKKYIDNIKTNGEECLGDKISSRRFTKELAEFLSGYTKITYDGKKFNIKIIGGSEIERKKEKKL